MLCIFLNSCVTCWKRVASSLCPTVSLLQLTVTDVQKFCSSYMQKRDFLRQPDFSFGCPAEIRTQIKLVMNETKFKVCRNKGRPKGSQTFTLYISILLAQPVETWACWKHQMPSLEDLWLDWRASYLFCTLSAVCDCCRDLSSCLNPQKRLLYGRAFGSLSPVFLYPLLLFRFSKGWLKRRGMSDWCFSLLCAERCPQCGLIRFHLDQQLVFVPHFPQLFKPPSVNQ